MWYDIYLKALININLDFQIQIILQIFYCVASIQQLFDKIYKMNLSRYKMTVECHFNVT